MEALNDSLLLVLRIQPGIKQKSVSHEVYILVERKDKHNTERSRLHNIFSDRCYGKKKKKWDRKRGCQHTGRRQVLVL